MSDILISYAREDAVKAKALADILTRREWSVWWDRSIAAGKTFDDEIERELSCALVVIVLWSRHSVKSEWVRGEAEDAAERGVLVPALLEPVRIPIRFRRIQSANLETWDGSPDDPELERLLSDVSSHIAERHARAQSVHSQASPAAVARHFDVERVGSAPYGSDATAFRQKLAVLRSVARQLTRGRPRLVLAVFCAAALALASFVAYSAFKDTTAVSNTRDESSKQLSNSPEASPPNQRLIDSQQGGDASVRLRLLDVYGRSLPGRVDIAFVPATSEGRRDSAKNEFSVSDVDASTTILVSNLAASLGGLYIVEINPQFHYPSSQIVALRPAETKQLLVMSPIFPTKVKRVIFPEYEDLPIGAHRLFEASHDVIGLEGKSGKTRYSALDEVRRANLLNVVAKVENIRLGDANKSLIYFYRFAAIETDRLFLYCDPTLSSALENNTGISRVPGSLHDAPDFAPGFKVTSSYRTREEYGFLRLTLFSDNKECLAGFDFDDAAALGHVFQGLRAYSSTLNSHPYTLHQILIGLHKIDPGYQLMP